MTSHAHTNDHPDRRDQSCVGRWADSSRLAGSLVAVLTSVAVVGALLTAPAGASGTGESSTPTSTPSITQSSSAAEPTPTEPTSTEPTPTESTGTKSGTTTQAAALGWRPPQDVIFNNPYGSSEARFRIERRVVQAIRNTPRGATIRISVYSFDRKDVAKALIDARRRGVTVQILLNDHQVTGAQRMLHRALGRNRWTRNFAYECNAACRGRRDNLHSKFFLFTQTGSARNVVMAGSANFTLNAVKWQWNDLVTRYSNPYLFWDYVNLFEGMRRDYSTNRPYYIFCGRRGSSCKPMADWAVTRVFPRGASRTNDAVLNMLKPIQCVYRGADGKTRRTKLRLSMHTMLGERGIYLAQRMRGLWAAGCDFKVIYGLMGWNVKQALGAVTRRGRIPLRSTGFDYNGDQDVDRYTHQKYFTVSGKYNSVVTNLSFTGSSNWSSRGTSGDEIIFSLRGGGPRVRYERQFNQMWNSGRYSRNAYTTTSSSYRRIVTVDGPDGQPVQKVVTVTRTVQQNLPDRLQPTGAQWESD